MTQYQSYNPADLKTGVPLYNYPASNSAPVQPVQQQPVQQQPGVTSPIYSYPVSSVYAPKAVNSQTQPSSMPVNNIYQYSQAPNSAIPSNASGVNINIYNPTGSGAAQNQPYQQSQMQTPQVNNSPTAAQPMNNTNPPAATSIDNNSYIPKKNVTPLTDEYIKTLEEYLHNPDKKVRESAIIQIGKRFEEDSSRYEDPALTALLNIALQDPDANNRTLAMLPISTGHAHGDKDSMKFLEQSQKSDNLFGGESRMATNAITTATQGRVEVPDNNPKPKSKDDESEEEEDII